MSLLQERSGALLKWIFQSAQAVPSQGLGDPAVLGLAAQQGRVLVSHDVTTMEVHFRDFIRSRDSPGLVIIPPKKVSIGVSIDSLLLPWELVDRTEMENRICLIPSLVIY